MALYGHIAAWDEGLAICPDAEALEWLDRQGTDRYVSIVAEGRRLLICPDDGEANPELRRRVCSRGTNAHRDFPNGVLFEWKLVQGDDLPRFALHDVTLHPGNDDLYLYADLPADHMLPWPKLRECGSYDVPSQVVRDLEMRMRSAKRSYSGLPPAKWTWVPMPKKFREMLAPGVYGDCLKAVIADRPYAVAA